MGMIRNPKVQGMIRGQREAVGRMFPKFAARMKPVWDRMDQIYGMKQDTAAGAQPAASAPLGAAPQSPRPEVTSKVLLGS